MTRRAPLALLLAALAAPAGAAEPSDLIAMRDAAAPGECSGEEAAQSQPFSGGTLHAVPCRPTAHDLLSVLVLERDGILQPLFFANPDFQLDYAADGALDWGRARVDGILVSPVVSQFEADDSTGTITVSARIAPGVGEGAFVHTYVLEDFGVTLHSAYVSLDGDREIPLWPPAGPGLLDEIGVSHDLEGFTEEPTPDALLDTPLQAAEVLEVFFPSDEEGRPRLDLSMEQQGDAVALTLLDHGWADDSVAGKAWRVLMAREGSGWRVTGLGSANICWRGSPRVTTGLCP